MPETLTPLTAGDRRLTAALDWAAQSLRQSLHDPVPVSGDASFRRYFRVQAESGPVILMDAPPDREDSRPFLDVARRLREAGLGAPQVLDFDLERGFGLVEDLGDRLYRDVLDTANADELVPPLLDTLKRFAQDVDHEGLPAYDDARLQQELDLFTDWYLARHRNRRLGAREQQHWEKACAVLRESAGEQPRVFVHRDFHSCNLLVRDGRQPGIIDFQDAVAGPLSYDFASLVWDRYIAWSRPRIERWMEDMRQRLIANGTGNPGVDVDVDVDTATWVRWCDLMGVQRNLKIVGIFARLHYRDGRDGYLGMIPQFYRYLVDVVPAYPELAALATLLEQRECAP